MLCTPSIVLWFVVVAVELRQGAGTRYQSFSRPSHSPSGVAACPRVEDTVNSSLVAP